MPVVVEHQIPAIRQVMVGIHDPGAIAPFIKPVPGEKRTCLPGIAFLGVRNFDNAIIINVLRPELAGGILHLRNAGFSVRARIQQPPAAAEQDIRHGRVFRTHGGDKGRRLLAVQLAAHNASSAQLRRCAVQLAGAFHAHLPILPHIVLGQAASLRFRPDEQQVEPPIAVQVVHNIAQVAALHQHIDLVRHQLVYG